MDRNNQAFQERIIIQTTFRLRFLLSIDSTEMKVVQMIYVELLLYLDEI